MGILRKVDLHVCNECGGEPCIVSKFVKMSNESIACNKPRNWRLLTKLSLSTKTEKIVTVVNDNQQEGDNG